MEGVLGESFLGGHVATVFLLCVEVPSSDRTFLVSLVHLGVVNLIVAVVDGISRLHHPAMHTSTYEPQTYTPL